MHQDLTWLVLIQNTYFSPSCIGWYHSTRRHLHTFSHHERAEALYGKFYSALLDNPPNDDATKYSFVTFWDTNIHKIIEALIPDGVFIRNSNCHMSTYAQWPNFGFLYLNVCPFRGEEKSPSNTDDPRVSLAIRWHGYMNLLPMSLVSCSVSFSLSFLNIFCTGYYVTGTMTILTAICCPVIGSRELGIVDLLQSDLWTKAGQIKNIVQLIYLCSLIMPITVAIGLCTTLEFIPIKKCISSSPW